MKVGLMVQVGVMVGVRLTVGVAARVCNVRVRVKVPLGVTGIVAVGVAVIRALRPLPTCRMAKPRQ